MMRHALKEAAGIRIVAMGSPEEAELASHIMAMTSRLEEDESLG